MSDIAIKVENLSKYYNLGVINSRTLSYDLQSWIWKKLGKEDPNKKIGAIESDATGFWALKDLNFEIKKGDRVGIIGKNGAGKSTLLKMISKISSPTNGKIYMDGKIASLLEVGTGFNPELTGRENIYLNGAILGMKKKDVDRKIDEIIAFSEIERHIDTPVKRYSSGMYVRLAFAVAAHLDSDILIADEVLAVGDATFQKKALGKMNDLSNGQGRTVLFVSHNMAQVKNLCNKGIVLEKGQIVRQDDDIEKSIDYYLGKNDDNSDIVTTIWHNDGTVGNQYFFPIKMKIHNADDNEDVFSVQIEFKVEQLMSDLYYRFYLYEVSTNICICSFSPFHSIDGYKPHVGINILSFSLPQNFFFFFFYSLELCATLYHKEYILKQNDNSPNLFFCVTKKNGFDPFGRDDTCRELLAPIVNWNEEK